MKVLRALLACGLLFVPGVHACGLTSKLVPFDAPSPQASTASADDLPVPIVQVSQIVRGIGSSHINCDDTGLLTLQVEWPRGKHRLRDLGFEFSVPSADPPYPMFPEGPVQAPVDGRRSDFVFMWQEGPPEQQSFIDMQLEVRAVTREGQRGPAATVLVRSPPGG